MPRTKKDFIKDIKGSEVYAIRQHLKAINHELTNRTHPDLGYLGEKITKIRNNLTGLEHRLRFMNKQYGAY